MSASVHSSGETSACLRSVDVSAEHSHRSTVVGVVLDRPRVGAGSHLSRHPHNADDHHAELGAPACGASWERAPAARWYHTEMSPGRTMKYRR